MSSFAQIDVNLSLETEISFLSASTSSYSLAYRTGGSNNEYWGARLIGENFSYSTWGSTGTKGAWLGLGFGDDGMYDMDPTICMFTFNANTKEVVSWNCKDYYSNAK